MWHEELREVEAKLEGPSKPAHADPRRATVRQSHDEFLEIEFEAFKLLPLDAKSR